MTQLDDLTSARCCPRPADRRLQLADDILHRASTLVLTLDVFDTLLWRTVAEPKHAFLLLGQQLLEAGATFLTPSQFAYSRMQAESRARRIAETQRGTSECTLLEIWQVLTTAAISVSVAEGMAAELDVERKICRPDLDVLAVAVSAKGCGLKVALVSDTYLSGVQLRSLLAGHVTPELELDGVFTSSDHGVAKSNGLLKAALISLEAAPPNVLHVGDNDVADVATAEELGCEAVYYDRGNKDLRDAWHLEGATASDWSIGQGVDLHVGDHGLSGLRARAIHRAPASFQTDELEPFFGTGAGVFGPAFTGFASWVQQRSRALGVDNVFCLMREGEFLSELVEAAGTAEESPVAASPLWLSRQVAALASIYRGDAEELKAFLRRRRPSTVAGLLDQFDVPLWLREPLQPVLNLPLDRPRVMEIFVETLEGSPDLRAAIAGRAATIRGRLFEHLDRRLPATGRIVLVDVGWSGTIQKLIAELLRRRGTPRDIVGLYLLTHAGAEDSRLDGLNTEGYLAQGGSPRHLLDPISRSPEVLEQLCLSDIGTMTGLAENGDVLTSSERVPRWQVREKVAVQQGIRAFQDLWLINRGAGSGDLSLQVPGARKSLLVALSRFFALPTPAEARRFGRWLHDENFGTNDPEPIVGVEMFDRALYLSPEGLQELSMNDSYWPAAAVAAASPTVAATTHAARQSTLTVQDVTVKSALDSFDFFVDCGSGFTHELMTREPVRSGPDGRSLIRTTFRDLQPLSLRIDPFGCPSILKLDWISLQAYDAQSAASSRSVLTTFDEAGAALVGARWLGQNVLEVTSDDPQLIIDLRTVDHFPRHHLHGLVLEVAISGFVLDRPLFSEAEQKFSPERHQTRSADNTPPGGTRNSLKQVLGRIL